MTRMSRLTGKHLGAALLGLASLPLSAGAQTLQPGASEIVFVSKQMGVPVEGRFKGFSLPGFRFDPRKPEAAQVAIQIDLRSASMGAADVEAELAKPEWFDSKRQPMAGFTAQSVKALGGGRFELQGPFVLKGISKPLAVQLQLTPAGLASGQFTLKRGDWQIGAGEWADTSIVGAEVVVKFKFQFSGMAPL